MATSSTPSTGVSSGPRLRRALTLWDLILYGVIVIQPVAPMSVFGVLSDRGHGHVVTTIFIAMVAMLFTAISYGRMARAYPSAGSAFTYVGQEINPALGYVTGWSMVMDYMLNPIICVIWCSQQAHVFAPGVPYWGWAVFFALVFTFLNVQGVKTSARVNAGLAAGMGVVIAIFFVAAARYLFGHAHDSAAFLTRPFYDPQSWNTKAVLGGTSVAVLTYIGFDGISTLSEEAENPRRNILLATVLTCLVIGILSALEVYAAQLVWPAAEPYPNVDTAFTFVAQRAWAPLFAVVGFTLVVANFGSGMGAQLGAARLLYGMGRSSALPKGFFGAIDRKRHVPRNNVLFVGALALLGAFLLPAIAGEATGYELGANLLNFGALLAFMGVNASAFVRYFLREKKTVWNFLPPVLGFFICALLWWNLSTKARIFGAIWMGVGIAIGAWKTRGFRGNLINFELPPEDAEA
ncbi:MAG TPA: APC family permease [Terriglobales bacterium]|nr:APC family permease [Terriglobales bacterium]